MGWNRSNSILLGLAVVLACARLAHGQGGNPGSPSASSSVLVPEAVPIGPPVPPPDPAVSNNNSSSLALPAPCPIERLPSVCPDAPVSYYSRYCQGDDIAPGNPIFELPGVKLGWIFNAEASFVQPFVHNGLNSGSLTVGSVPQAVSVPQARADFSVMPTLDAGYRFEEGLGEAHAVFNYLGNTSTRTIANFDTAGAGTVVSRINLDVLDLQYGFLEFNPGRLPRANPLLMIPGRLGLNQRPEEEVVATPLMIKWFFGARVANAFFDSQGAGAQILSQRVTNNFVGGGPEIGVDITKPFANSAWSLYARFQTSGLAGEITQSFARTELLPGGGTASGYARQSSLNVGVPVIDVWFGARYVPQWRNRMLRFTGGYRFEQWFYLGESPSSEAELTLNGGFLRAEYGF